MWYVYYLGLWISFKWFWYKNVNHFIGLATACIFFFCIHHILWMKWDNKLEQKSGWWTSNMMIGARNSNISTISWYRSCVLSIIKSLICILVCAKTKNQQRRLCWQMKFELLYTVQISLYAECFSNKKRKFVFSL